MEINVNFPDYQSNVKRTANPETGLQGWALWLTSEAGEVAGAVIKITEQDMTTIKGVDAIDAVEGEIGDALFCLAQLCNYLGLDLGIVAKKNVEKLEKRYPSGFVKGGGIR